MKRLGLAATALFASLAFLPAAAQEGKVTIELNKIQDVDSGCRLTFLMLNGLESQVERMSFEVAVVNKSGLVSGLILMRSGQLPPGLERVKQFDLPDVDCATVDRLILNEIVECEGGQGPVEGCTEAVVARAKGEVSFE